MHVQAHFDAAVSSAGGSIRSARVAKRKGPDGKPLSAGFGFVECSSEEVAKIGISKMQVRMLYSASLGHTEDCYYYYSTSSIYWPEGALLGAQ